ncbi:MAG: hypothetical protein AB1Z67_03490, partial [Candidatus Limnocylindrales bacterium]
ADIPDWTCDPTTPVASLAAGGTIECTGTYTIDRDDIFAGSVINAACVDSAETDEVCDDVETPVVEVETTPFPSTSPSPSPTLKPTDMLPATDAFGSGDDGDPMGGLLNWAIWLMLSALLIVGTGLIIRREKLAEVRNR